MDLLVDSDLVFALDDELFVFDLVGVSGDACPWLEDEPSHIEIRRPILITQQDAFLEALGQLHGIVGDLRGSADAWCRVCGCHHSQIRERQLGFVHGASVLYLLIEHQADRNFSRVSRHGGTHEPDYLCAADDLPDDVPAKATITTKEINDNHYYYWQWRNEEKVRSQYRRPIESDGKN